jgi:hypothetical protein
MIVKWKTEYHNIIAALAATAIASNIYNSTYSVRVKCKIKTKTKKTIAVPAAAAAVASLASIDNYR